MKPRIAVLAWLIGVGVSLFMAPSAVAQTLTMLRNLDAPHYDPARTTSGATTEVSFLIGDTLVALDYDLKTITPLLAASWTISPDGKLYTFRLRDDVTFCSGKKLTSADVIYSFKRVLDPETKAPFLWRMGPVKDIRAPDPLTVEYELTAPYGELLIQLTNFQATVVNQGSTSATLP